MHRIDTPTSEDGLFVNGNANQGIKGTQVDASWLNSVQEEICNVIESAGDTLSDESNNQLKGSLDKLYLRNVLANQQNLDKSFIMTSKTFDLFNGTAIDPANNFLPVKFQTIPKHSILDMSVSFLKSGDLMDGKFGVQLFNADGTTANGYITKKNVSAKENFEFRIVYENDTNDSKRLCVAVVYSDTIASSKTIGIGQQQYSSLLIPEKV